MGLNFSHAYGSKKDFSFFYSGFRSFYSCSFIENRIEQSAELLGAQIVDLRCSGGIDLGFRHVRVRGTLETLEVDSEQTQNWKKVVLSERTFRSWDPFNSGCEITYRAINELLKLIPHRELVKSNGCWEGQGRFRFEVEIPE
jgi:hypothetical protein